MEPEKMGGLEDDVPFETGDVPGEPAVCFRGGYPSHSMDVFLEPRVIYSRCHGEEIVVRAKVKRKLCSIVKECDVYSLVFNLKNT